MKRLSVAVSCRTGPGAWVFWLLAPGSLTSLATALLWKECARPPRHVYLTAKGARVHSPSHGVVTGHFLLKIAQVPSLFVEDTRGK